MGGMLRKNSPRAPGAFDGLSWRLCPVWGTEAEGTNLSRSPDAGGLMTRARAAATGATTPARGGNALTDFRAKH
jgi:hypothetical protein